MAKKEVSIIIKARDLAAKKFVSLRKQIMKLPGAIAGNVMKKAFSVFTGAISAIIRLLKRLAKAAVVAFGVIVALVIKTGATFTKEMSRVKALTKATAQEFDALTDAARRLGETTQFTAVQASQAMSELAKAGFEVNEIIAAMPDVLNLAAAGQLEMGEASGILAGIMRGMSLEAKDLGNVVDILATAFTGSLTDLNDLGEAMRTIGPIANFAGLQLEEVTAVLMVLANANFQGERGGTAFRNIMIRLTSATGETKKTLDRLLPTLTNASGGFKTIADIVDEVGFNLRELPVTEKLSKLIQVFGVRAGPAFAALINEGSDSIRNFRENLDDIGGAGLSIARTQLDNLSGDFTLLTSTLAEVKLAIFDVFEKDLRGIVQRARQFFIDNKDTIVEWATVAREKIFEVRDSLKVFIDFARNDFAAGIKVMRDIFVEILNGMFKIAVKAGIVLGKSILTGIRVGLTGELVSGSDVRTAAFATAKAQEQRAIEERRPRETERQALQRLGSRRERVERLEPFIRKTLEDRRIDEIISGAGDIGGIVKQTTQNVAGIFPRAQQEQRETNNLLRQMVQNTDPNRRQGRQRQVVVMSPGNG